ncbi:MAG: hypothetical protein WKG07_29085 [Hymenobacter sp.]
MTSLLLLCRPARRIPLPHRRTLPGPAAAAGAHHESRPRPAARRHRYACGPW